MAVFSWMGIAVSCAAVLGFFSNLLIIAVRYFTKRTSTTFQILLGILAFNDLILSILFGLLSPLIYQGYMWIYPAFACKLLYPLITTLTTVSVGTILLISFERYQAIVHPFKPKFSTAKTFMVILAIWVVSILSITPNIIALKLTADNICYETWGSDVAPKIYSVVLLVVIYAVPLITIATFHIVIVYKLKRSNNVRSSSVGRRNSQAEAFNFRRKRNMKIMRLLVLISVAFAICILPTKIAYIIADFAKEAFVDLHDALHVYQLLFYFHVVINPVLYSLNDKTFRKDIHRILSCRVTQLSSNSVRLTT